MNYDIQKDWDDYGLWLIERVGFRKRGYSKLLQLLHQSPFVAILTRDESRVEDGKYLRSDYLMIRGFPPYIFDYEDCSVLEMLVAFAIRIDSEWIGDPGEAHPEIIFWEMIQNLGFQDQTNGRMDPDFVIRTLGIWIKREFHSDGKGSIFPLKRPRCDQTKVEIWRQMTAYLTENY